MAAFNEEGDLVEDPDLSVGYIEQVEQTVYHVWVQDSEEEGHWEVVAEYPNGGNDEGWVVDSPATGHWEVQDEDGNPVEHYDGFAPDPDFDGFDKGERTPDIWAYGVYRAYTEDELAEIAEDEERERVESQRSEQMRTAASLMVRMQAPAMTDAQCLSVSLLFDDWREGIECGKGEVYRYGGLIYRCKQGHTSQTGWEPGAATASLWTAITPDGPQPWQPGQSYDLDAEVTHGGKTWVSLVPNNVWEPGTPGTGNVWADLGEIPTDKEA